MHETPWTVLSKTAFGAARVRAEESRRPDRLFHDPYAAGFVAAVPNAFPEEERDARRDDQLVSIGALFSASVVLRTRFYDDYLFGACASGCRQVVLLGAGLDTRAFRLDWPDDTQVFELDLPEVLAFKEAVLQGEAARPLCRRIVVPVDLGEDWSRPLIAAGFVRDERTAWLAEGLLIYLSAAEAVGLLAAVTELSGSHSQLAFEHDRGDDAGLRSRAHTMPALRQFASLWKGGLGADSPGWLTQHGWQVQIHDATALASSYGRAMPAEASGGYLVASRPEGSAVRG